MTLSNVLAGVLATALLASGATVAVAGAGGPNPESAAGLCGGAGSSPGIGDLIGQNFIPILKSDAELEETSLGEQLKTNGKGFGIPVACAPGQQP